MHMSIRGPVPTVQASAKSSSKVHREPPYYIMLEPGLVNHLEESNVTDRVERLGDVHCHCDCAPWRLLHVESLGNPRDQRKKGGHTVLYSVAD